MEEEGSGSEEFIKGSPQFKDEMAAFRALSCKSRNYDLNIRGERFRLFGSTLDLWKAQRLYSRIPTTNHTTELLKGRPPLVSADWMVRDALNKKVLSASTIFSTISEKSAVPVLCITAGFNV